MTAKIDVNVFRLAASQALMMSAIVMSMAVAGILGAQLAPDAGLATLPIAAMVIGSGGRLPAGRVADAPHRPPQRFPLRRDGRRRRQPAVRTRALQEQSFALFVLGHFLLGTYQGFANYYRFAAVEASAPAHSSRAISLVVAGGIVAAFLGPQIGQWGRDWFPSELFVGSYLIQAALSVAALFLLLGLRLPAVAPAQTGAARPLGEIVRQPALLMSIFGASVGYCGDDHGHDGNAAGHARLRPAGHERDTGHPVACGWHVRAVLLHRRPG